MIITKDTVSFIQIRHQRAMKLELTDLEEEMKLSVLYTSNESTENHHNFYDISLS
jgi:hypothetical protein